MSGQTHSRIEVGEGHVLNLWSQEGLDGVPVLLLHGGPGAAMSPQDGANLFSDGWRLFGFDQRGSGKSTPAGEICANDTCRLVEDIERVRRHFGCEQWVVFGRSWGAYLALRYGSEHSSRCLGFLLFGLFLPGLSAAAALFNTPIPDEFGEVYAQFVPQDERENLLAAYARRIHGADRAQAVAAASQLTAYQSHLSRGRVDPGAISQSYTPEQMLAYARLLTHFALNEYFAEESDAASLINPIRSNPCHLVHGTADRVCPVENSRMVAAAWPGAGLREVEGAPHAIADSRNQAAIMEAAALLRSQLG